MLLKFKVTKQFGARGPEDLVAQFKHEQDAMSFIKSELRKAADLRQEVTYYLDDHIKKKEFKPGDDAGDMGPSSAGQGSKQSFSPSPLSNAPRVPGMPSKWWKDEEDENK